MTGWLDRLNPAVRHALLVASGIVFSALIQYVQANYTSWNLSPQLVGILGFLIPMIVQVLTPITTSFGVGSTPADPTGGVQ